MSRSEMSSSSTRSWALVTVTYNSAADLAHYWENVRLPEHAEWIVVDNCSTDDSVDVATGLGARVIPLKKNRGFSAANNIGARASSADLLGFVNPDVSVEPSSFRTLSDSIIRTNGIVAPQLVYPNGALQPNGRGLPTLSNKFRNRIGEGDMEGSYNLLPAEPGLYHAAWLMGAAVCMQRTTFDAIGGWNSRYFVYFEDAELGIRAHSMRIPVLLEAHATWTHGWARAPKRRSLRGWRLELASAARFYFQYPWMVTNRSAELKFSDISSLVGTSASGLAAS